MRAQLVRVTALVLAFSLVASLAFNGLRHLGEWSGDALIHLSLAERAARGAWFELNAGEPVAAETSIAWLGVEALLVRAGGMRAVLVLVPFIEIAAMIATAWLAFVLARRAGAARIPSALGALSAIALPGVAFNAALGMESMLFAAAALAFLACFTSRGALGRAWVCGLALGVAALVRPEGFLLGVVLAMDLRSVHGARRAAVTLGVAALVIAPPLAFQFARTGSVLSTASGWSRVMMARRRSDSLHVVGPIWIYGAAFVRLVVYAPLSIAAFVALLHAPVASDSARRVRHALGLVAGAGIAIYGLVAGSAHVARHTTWLFAIVSTLAAVGVERLTSAPRRTWHLVAMAAVLVGVMAAETTLRSAVAPPSSADVARLVADRVATTDSLRAAICAGGCCRGDFVPRILATEVQLRLSLDDRIAIASTDGRTDPSVRFDARGCPSIGAELADSRVVAVAEPLLADLPSTCSDSELGRAIDRAWGGQGNAPAGWSWSGAAGMMTRRCVEP